MIKGFKLVKMPLPRGWKVGDKAYDIQTGIVGLVVDFDKHTLTVAYPNGSELRLLFSCWRKDTRV